MEEKLRLLAEIKQVLCEKDMDAYTRKEMITSYYNLMSFAYDEAEEEGKKELCREDIVFLLPYTETNLKSYVESGETKLITEFYQLWKLALAFAGRRSLEHFIDYMEIEMPAQKKVLGNRRRVLHPFVYYLNKCAFDDNLQYVIASFPPSYGKTYTANMFSAWLYGLDVNNSIIRLSYSERNVENASTSIKEIISNPLFSDVFPFYKQFKGRLFYRDKLTDWILNGKSNTESSHTAVSRDSSINGVRANKAMIFDDMSKDDSDALNEETLERYYLRWLNTWSSRMSNDKVKYIFCGTMWSPKDLINRVIKDQEKKCSFVPSNVQGCGRWVKVATDGSTAVIKVPLIDNHECTCKAVMSTEKALTLQANDDEYYFSCVYMQDPIPPTGLEFADDSLLHYDKLPVTSEGVPKCGDYCFASLDPARKGIDNVSMPIFKTDGQYHYLIDCIFAKKAMSELYNDIVDKIIDNKIIKLVVETNTDTSLISLLKGKLEERGYFNCELIPKYTTRKKEDKIRDMRGIIKRKILFKDKKNYNANSDYGRFMKNFTTYSFDYANKHDDAPDSVAMYCEDVILGKGILAKPKAINRSLLGF